MAKSEEPINLRDTLRCPPGPVDVERDCDSCAEPHYPGEGKEDADDQREAIEPLLDELQERLYAQGKEHPDTAPSVLLVLQGMDTSGKGGVIRHAIGMVDPQGVHLHAFKAPTKEERKHDFLWRIRRELPARGEIGIFDRSQYEDVLVQRVEGMAPAQEIEARYAKINQFEAEIAAAGTVIIKCYLHISKDEQKKRLEARLADPDKHWKYNPGDVDVRAKWDQYVDAYNVALERCNLDVAPWYIIPSDKKWYRNWAVTKILVETMSEMGLRWPLADFDVELEKKRVAQS